MPTITINGVELSNDDAKTVRRELGKARRAEEKADKERAEKSDRARSKARDIGFDILARKASGQTFPRAWRIYREGDEWAKHAFSKVAGEPETIVQCGPQTTKIRHYGHDFLGAATGCGGYTQAIFLQDRDDERKIVCYAVGTADDNVHYLAELPGVEMSDFHPAGD